MRAAIVGLGVIGKLHAELAKERAELVAVCDTDERKLVDYGAAAKYSDYIRMLDECKPDVVHICTPHYLHAEMIVAALERNVHVLCEKPLCIRAEEIDAVSVAERNSRAQLGVCLQNRYLAVNRFVKSYLQNDPPVSAVGYVAWHRDKTYYDSASWRGKSSTEGGGVLINQALHTLDLLQWFCGDVQSLRATTSNLTLQDAIETEDTASVLCEAEAPFTFFATNGNESDFPVLISLKTKRGILQITPQRVTRDGETLFEESSLSYRGKPCYGSGHDLLIEDFYRCAETGEKFPIDGKEAAKVVRLVLAAYRSEGKRVEP